MASQTRSCKCFLGKTALFDLVNCLTALWLREMGRSCVQYNLWMFDGTNGFSISSLCVSLVSNAFIGMSYSNEPNIYFWHKSKTGYPNEHLGGRIVLFHILYINSNHSGKGWNIHTEYFLVPCQLSSAVTAIAQNALHITDYTPNDLLIHAQTFTQGQMPLISSNSSSC